MPEQPNGSQPPMRNRREAEMDFDDFVDLRQNSSKKSGNASKKRQSRGSRKTDLRDAMLDPDSLDEYMDEFGRQ